jgi:glycosyltransferase involved in cell wall biosynthesis
MKITIIQGAFLPVPPIMGGAVEKMWLRLGQEFVQAGHEVTHISRQHSSLPKEDEIEGVRHIRVHGYNTPNSILKLKWLDLIYSRRACRMVPPDSQLVVTNTFWSPLMLRNGGKSKAYVDVARMPKGQMRLYSGARLRANSTPVAAAIRGELPARDHDRIVVIPNPLPFVVNDELDVSLKPPVLLYCGRVHPEKGLHLAIQAMRLLENPWPLRIVGPWETGQGGGGEAYKNKLAKAAQGLPVTFVGPVHEVDTLNEEYRSAAIFLYPSVAVKGETFGLAPLEAMAWGCAPIVSNLDCFKDFIRHGENGLIFDHDGPAAVTNLAESIRRLSCDPMSRHKFGRAALKVRQTHSSRAIARLFLDDFAYFVDVNNR